MRRIPSSRVLINVAAVLIAALMSISTASAQRPTEAQKLPLYDQANTLVDLAKNFRAQAQGHRFALDNATSIYLSASSIYESVGSVRESAFCTHQAGYIYWLLEDTPKAIETYNSALTLWRRAGDADGEATTLTNLGIIFGETSENAKAMEMFESALAIRRRTHSRIGEAATLNAIGVIQYNQGEYRKALQSFNEALQLFTGEEGGVDRADAINNLASVLHILGKQSEAKTGFQKAWEYYQSKEDVRGKAVTLNNLGSLYAALSERNEARRYLDLANALWSKYEARSNTSVSVSASAIQDQGTKPPDAEQDRSLVILISRIVGIRSAESVRLGNIKETFDAPLRGFGELGFKSNKIITTYPPSPPDPPVNRSEQISYSRGEAATMANLGAVISERGDRVASLWYLQNALNTQRQRGDRKSEAATSNNIGETYRNLDQPGKGSEYLNNALVLAKLVGDRPLEVAILNNLALLDNSNGDKQASLKRFEAAQALKAKIEDPFTETAILNNSALLQSDFGNNEKALQQLQQSLKIQKETGDRGGEGVVLNNVGFIDDILGERERALKHFDEAIAIHRSLGNKGGEAISLTNIGSTLAELQQLEKSLDYYAQALKLWLELDRKSGRAIVSSNIGLITSELGDKKRALELLSGSLNLFIELGDRANYENTLSNIGVVLADLGKYQDALEYLNTSLKFKQSSGDKRAQGSIIGNIGRIYSKQGEHQKAVEEFSRALTLQRETGDRSGEARTLTSLMLSWSKLKSRRLAIFYGKQSVNVYQQLRGGIRGLEQETRDTYLKSVEDTYRNLADVLMQEDRIAEAQAVLALLKEDEFKSFVRDASEAKEQAQLTPTDIERKALEEYSRLSSDITKIGARIEELARKRNCSGCKLGDAEEKEFKELEGNLDIANEGFREFVKRLESEFAKEVEGKAVVTPETIEALQSDLRVAGPDVVLVSTYLLNERYRAIVTTGNTMVDRKTEFKDIKLTEEQVKDKIIKFHNQLQSPTVDPRPLGKELYDIFIKPIEKDLRDTKAKTILWSLDGRLRYIPIGALSPDGKRYFAEDFQNVIVTLARQSNLFTESSKTWRVLGAGVSKQYSGFDPLNKVPEELRAIVRDDGNPAGAFVGEPMLNERFTLERFSDGLRRTESNGAGRQESAFNVVHLATHFKLEANNRDSAMLLGDGSLLPLDRFAGKSSLSFSGVELVTLSACKTAVPIGEGNGREVEGFGMIAQQKGAKAVIASLWSVNDESTSLLMAEFYRIKKDNPSITKAEALQRAQLAMINGKLKPSDGKSEDTDRTSVNNKKASNGGGAIFKPDPSAPFSHPYFWSPFVLIGNWR